jgi:hypothetical protein
MLMAGPAQAVRSTLTWAEVEEAVARGKAAYVELKNGARPLDDLDPRYVVDLGADVGRAMLFTESSSVELETRRWLAINRDLKPEDLEILLGPLRGKLKFSVTVVGAPSNFLRAFTARLLQGDTRQEPLNWDVFRGSPQPGSRTRFVASGEYLFAAKELDLNTPVTLLLSDPTAGKEIRFEFDLSRLQ